MKKEIVNAANPLVDAPEAKDELLLAGILTSGAFVATNIVGTYVKTSVSPENIYKSVGAQINCVNSGDLAQLEGMLLGQAIALQSMFHNLAERAKGADSLPTLQCLTQLALRAQAGSRSTLQTLIEAKNPRQVAFVKQTNVAQTQQVNNGCPLPSREKKIKDQPIELLVKDSHGSTKMDSGAKAKAGGVDKELVSLDASHGAQKHGRKAKGIS